MTTPEQNYRPLGPDEVIQDGDEFNSPYGKTWIPCNGSIGETPKDWPMYKFRRLIIDSLRAQLATVTEERDRFKAALRKISCMYCGRQWSIDDPTSNKLLADHILSCDKSPLVSLLMNLTVGLTPLMETLNRVAGDPETGWHGSIRIDDKFIEALTLAREAVKGNEVPALVELRAQLTDAEPKGKALSLSLSGDPDKLAAERAVNKAIVADLKEKLAESEKEVKRLKDACSLTEHDVQQIAGKALGYPWFKDDQTNFPGATEADGVCVGEHVAASIVSELASKYADAEADKRSFSAALTACREATGPGEPGFPLASDIRVLVAKLAEPEKKREAEKPSMEQTDYVLTQGQIIHSLRAQLEVSKALLAAVESERDQLRARAETAERERDEARATIESIRMVVVKLDGSCSTSRIIEEVEHVILAWNKRAADAIAERDRLQAELAKCREALGAIHGFQVHSEPYGAALTMQDIATAALEGGK